METVGRHDHTPWWEVMIRDVLRRIGGPRGGRGRRRGPAAAALTGLPRLDRPGHRGPSSAVPDVQAVAPPASPPRAAHPGPRQPLTVPPAPAVPPGETAESVMADAALELARRHAVVSDGTAWYCLQCQWIGHEADRTAAALLHAEAIANRTWL